MHVLFIYYYAGSRVRPRVFCAHGYGCKCRFLSVAGYSTGCRFKIQPISTGLYISHHNVPVVIIGLGLVQIYAGPHLYSAAQTYFVV